MTHYAVKSPDGYIHNVEASETLTKFRFIEAQPFSSWKEAEVEGYTCKPVLIVEPDALDKEKERANKYQSLIYSAMNLLDIRDEKGAPERVTVDTFLDSIKSLKIDHDKTFNEGLEAAEKSLEDALPVDE